MPETALQESRVEVGDVTRVTLAELVRLKGSVRRIKRPVGQRVMAPLRGGNVSKALGRGLDFSEVREYQPGDDVRSIDWKVTARSGRAHTKIYEEERERPFLIALDMRSTMLFATRVAFKSVIAARLAAMVAWAAAANRDRVGGLVFSDAGIREVKPAAGSKGVTRLINEVITTQERALAVSTAEPPGVRFNDIFHHLRRSAHTGCSVVMLSDFAHCDVEKNNAASQLISHNHVVAVRIFDELERQLPPPASYNITDGVRKGTINTASKQLRESYALAFATHCRQTKKLFTARNSHYLECSTSDALAPVAHGILSRLPGSM